MNTEPADSTTATLNDRSPMPTADMLANARDDIALATALHESGHALTYLERGVPFQQIDPEGLVVAVPGTEVLVWDYARINMAGPAVEAIMFYGTTEPNAAAVRYVLDGLTEARDYAADDPDDPDAVNDYTSAGAMAEVELPGAFALMSTNWQTIEAIAALVLETPTTPTSYEAVRALVPEQVDTDPELLRGWLPLIFPQ